MNRPSIDGMSTLPNCKAQLLVCKGTGRLCLDLVLCWKGRQTRRSPKKDLAGFILFLASYLAWKITTKSSWPVQLQTVMRRIVGDALAFSEFWRWTAMLGIYLKASIDMYVHKWAYIYINIFIYTHTYIYNIHAYIRTYIHTYIYISIHTK